MNEITAKVNKLVARIQTDSITETNQLLIAVRNVVADKIGLREVDKQTSVMVEKKIRERYPTD